MQILVNAGEFSLTSMNKCDIGQLEVHDVEVCPLYYQLVPGRLVRSKKRSEALSVAVSTNVGFFVKRFGRVPSPRKDGSGFLYFVRRKSIGLLKRYLFYHERVSYRQSDRCREKR